MLCQGGTSLEQRIPNVTADCRAVTDALARAGDKWTVLIVMQLETGSKRFSALRRTINGVSQKMLAVTLRGLERDGYVSRTVHPTKPPSVEYALTALGHEMVVPVRTFGDWIMTNLDRIENARREFDARDEP